MSLLNPRDKNHRYLAQRKNRAAVCKAVRRASKKLTPEHKLWIAVLELAINEIGCPLNDSSHWFENGGYKNVLSIIEVDDEYFRDLMHLAGLAKIAGLTKNINAR